jgi:hypothetical protein
MGRYHGLAHAHLQAVAVAVTINLDRFSERDVDLYTSYSVVRSVGCITISPTK